MTGYFSKKSGNESVEVTASSLGFGFDGTRVHTINLRGQNLLRGPAASS